MVSNLASLRADIVGSLLRPSYLKEAVAKFEAGQINATELAAVEDRAALENIALQESVGLQVLTDGEVRRQVYTDPLVKSLSGYTAGIGSPAPTFRDTQGQLHELGRQAAVTEQLGLKQNLALREFSFVRDHTQRTVKATLPSLSFASGLWAEGVSGPAYPTRERYMQDVLQLMREVVAQLVAAGARYIQLDAPRYTYLASELGLSNLRHMGLNMETWLGDMIALDNALIAGFPEVTFAMHFCRGNGRSMWAAEGSYDAIAEQLFSDLTVERLLLEYDSPRAGTFAPLRFVLPGKTVVLGLISTKVVEVESAELLKRRMEEAAQYIPLDRRALSPQCGFASLARGNMDSQDEQRAKLERLTEVARDVWG
jgi:5-methyltetrahydropteroyltriglutamate--homocysteine methyltransferase